MNEPRWRTVLCWSAVIMFFTMPLVVFILHLMSIERGWNVEGRWAEFKAVGVVYQTVSALVFGLAGLNSWDKRTQQQGPPKTFALPKAEPDSPPKPIQSKRSN